MAQANSFRLSFGISLFAHILLFLILFTSVLFNSDKPYVLKKGQAKQIVHAVAINQQQVESEVNHLKAERLAKQKAQREHLEKLQRLADEAKTLRARELKSLQNLREKNLSLKKEQAHEQRAARKRLEVIKKAQELAQHHLNDLEKKQTQALSNFKSQQKKLAELKQKQLKMAQAKQKTQDAKALLAKQLAEEKQQLAAAKAQYIDGIVNKYVALVRMAIHNNWLEPPNATSQMQVTLQIDTTDSGQVTQVNIVNSSGDKALDQSARLAVLKASPLPLPTNNSEALKQFRQFSITMHPS